MLARFDPLDGELGFIECPTLSSQLRAMLRGRTCNWLQETQLSCTHGMRTARREKRAARAGIGAARPPRPSAVKTDELGWQRASDGEAASPRC